MSLPFNLPLRTVLTFDGQRIRFEGQLDDDLLEFRDLRTGKFFKATDPLTGEVGAPTLEWFRSEHASGRLKRQGPTVVDGKGREREIARLDSSACAARDKKAPWRLRWAMAAHKAGLPRTDEAYGKFISSKRENIVSEHGFAPPGASSLRRHVRKLDNVGQSMSVFVSASGRHKGQTQLSKSEDMLVQDIALRYWATESWCIRDAHAVLQVEWDELVEVGVEGLGEKCPSYETLRLRVRSLETFSTVKAKWGQERAERKYQGVGEPVAATRPFDRVYMDGTELEQISIFGEDLPVAASKMKAVILMDAFSEFVFPPCVFSGPYREEMSIEAIIRMMTPPTDLSEEDLSSEPWAAWAYGTAVTLVPDNDRTLVPPGYLPALFELGTEVELPETYHSDAKAPLESFHRWLKGRMRGLPGTVLSPRLRKGIKRNPVEEAALTGAQIRRIVQRLFWEHNTTSRASLGDRSPLEVLKSHMIAGGGPVIDDHQHTRRMLAKTVIGKVLTDNGIKHDGIRYRSDDIGRILEDNAATTPVSDKIEGTETCNVTIRTYEGDLDTIEVFNEARKEFVTFYSTQPNYTAGLSRWEHNEYHRVARLRREQFKTEEQRRRSRARTLELIKGEASIIGFRQRANMAVLRECEQVRFMSGKRAHNGVPPAPLPEHFIPAATLEQRRNTPAAPPPGPKKSADVQEAASTSGTPAAGGKAQRHESRPMDVLMKWGSVPTELNDIDDED